MIARPALLGVTLLCCSCGKIADWRMQRKIDTWNRRVAEYEAENGIWKVTAPGLKGFVYPAGIESQATNLLLTDVLMAEHILRTQLPLLDTVITYPAPPVRWKLHRYVRQYKGFRDNDGHLHLHINAVWDDQPGDKGWTGMKDGGNLYWQVWVDVDNGRLYRFSVNGEA
ncbi:hypothetical protein ACQKLP_05355 [Chitinophaga sp. NPDC101104]|uniref:hypothetical protein n=1 Tax=Chitinophaga sp. NPDC101104 TaxID=3390561 RepID=UPI003D07CC89